MGSFVVGKTSLIERFVYNRFDEKYLTTIGVKISQKVLPPVQDFLIEDVTEQALAIQAMNQQKYELFLYTRNADFRRKFLSESILGNSKAIHKVRQIIHKLAEAPTTTILLMGETGTGKNIAARVIHQSSMLAEAPFVEISR